MSDRRQGLPPMALALLGLFGMAVFSAAGAWREREDALRLMRHYRLAGLLLESQRMLARSERAQRDYLRGGGRADLEECQSAVLNLDALLRRAGSLALEPDLRAQLDRMVPLLARYAAVLQGGLETAARRGRAEAARRLDAEPTRAKLQNLSQAIADVSQEEGLRLEAMTETSEHRFQESQWWMTGVLLLAATSLAIRLRRREFRRPDTLPRVLPPMSGAR